jgi:NADH:ubiquinone oxidoreductase subunit 2 (subunit N)
VIAAFFYLRIAFTLVTAPEDDEAVAETLELPRRIDACSGIVLFVTAALVLAVGLVPGSFIHFARDATFFL